MHEFGWKMTSSVQHCSVISMRHKYITDKRTHSTKGYCSKLDASSCLAYKAHPIIAHKYIYISGYNIVHQLNSSKEPMVRFLLQSPLIVCLGIDLWYQLNGTSSVSTFPTLPLSQLEAPHCEHVCKDVLQAAIEANAGLPSLWRLYHSPSSLVL